MGRANLDTLGQLPSGPLAHRTPPVLRLGEKRFPFHGETGRTGEKSIDSSGEGGAIRVFGQNRSAWQLHVFPWFFHELPENCQSCVFVGVAVEKEVPVFLFVLEQPVDASSRKTACLMPKTSAPRFSARAGHDGLVRGAKQGVHQRFRRYIFVEELFACIIFPHAPPAVIAVAAKGKRAIEGGWLVQGCLEVFPFSPPAPKKIQFHAPVPFDTPSFPEKVNSSRYCPKMKSADCP